ncbi:MAG: hypothetical protein ACOYNM_16465, partial [Gemmataceae bacterium]
SNGKLRTYKPAKPKLRIFTAKTLRTLSSSKQARISFLPLRSLRLGGENAFKHKEAVGQGF